MSATDLEKLKSLLVEAAEQAVAAGLCPHEFMAACDAAYTMAHPATREHLEATEILRQLDELRRQGRVGQA